MNNDFDTPEIRKRIEEQLSSPEGRKDFLADRLVPDSFVLLSAEEMQVIQNNVLGVSGQLALWQAAAIDQLGEKDPKEAHRAMKRLKQRSELGSRMQTALKMLLATGLSMQQRRIISDALKTDLLVQP